MPESEESGNREARERDRSSERAVDEPVAEGIAAQFAASTLRVGLAFFGIVLLLFGIGQAVGMDLLGLLTNVLNDPVARWLAVALFGLVLISVAFSGFRRPPR